MRRLRIASKSFVWSSRQFQHRCGELGRPAILNTSTNVRLNISVCPWRNLDWGWMEKVHPDDIAFKVKTWLKNLQSEAPHDAVCRFRGADGRYRWFNVRGDPRRRGPSSERIQAPSNHRNGSRHALGNGA